MHQLSFVIRLIPSSFVGMQSSGRSKLCWMGVGFALTSLIMVQFMVVPSNIAPSVEPNK